jgi:cell division septum initiation protein DivIVA
MSIKNKVKIKTFTGSGSFDIRDEMINDSKDFLDTVEVTTIAQECVNLKKVEDEIAEIEEQLKKKKEEADHISSKVIPELLAEQGLSENKVSVKQEFRCTLPKDETKRAQAYEWLRNEKLGDIIKNNVFVTFGKGEDDKAKSLIDLAVANGYEPSQKSDVAWNTLTALYEERVKAGLDMPSDVFHLWIKDKTKISRK